MQRQPTPRLDLDHKGYFLSLLDALGLVCSASAFTDLLDLPSSAVDEKKSKKRAREKWEKVVSKAAGIRNWEGKKVRAFITCYSCDKRWCIYVRTDDGYAAAMRALQQKMEFVSDRFCYGNLLFDDSHPLSKILVQKQDISCESKIEIGY